MANRKAKTIGARVRQLMTRKNPMTYDQIVDTVRTEFPRSQVSKGSVQWYASRMRTRDGVEPNVRLG
jgi:hypothetical protein